MSEDLKPQINPTATATFVRSILDKMKITKIVCTRSLKLKNGDVYVGMSSAWDTTQDDGTHDLIDSGLEESSGFSMKEAKIASYLLGLQVDQAAYDRALASGYMGKESYEDHIKKTRANYNSLIQRELSK